MDDHEQLTFIKHTMTLDLKKIIIIFLIIYFVIGNNNHIRNSKNSKMGICKNKFHFFQTNKFYYFYREVLIKKLSNAKLFQHYITHKSFSTLYSHSIQKFYLALFLF
jgi:hypothetical protein